MQEPLLFNYSITENILYGNLKATNEQVYNAAQVANALEFIEKDDLLQAFDDDPLSLKQALESEQFKSAAIDSMT